MLRETRAKWLAFVTAVLVVALAALFAWLRNRSEFAPPASAPVGAPATVDDSRSSIAHAVFERLNCAQCHALGGRGNPASPLDGVSNRRDAAAIRDWALGEGSAREQLPTAVVRMKAGAVDDPDLPALIDYLARSK